MKKILTVFLTVLLLCSTVLTAHIVVAEEEDINDPSYETKEFSDVSERENEETSEEKKEAAFAENAEAELENSEDENSDETALPEEGAFSENSEAVSEIGEAETQALPIEDSAQAATKITVSVKSVDNGYCSSRVYLNVNNPDSEEFRSIILYDSEDESIHFSAKKNYDDTIGADYYADVTTYGEKKTYNIKLEFRVDNVYSYVDTGTTVLWNRNRLILILWKNMQRSSHPLSLH